MNEYDKGNKRGDSTRQSSIQPEEKTGKHFIRNGFEIFSFDSKAIVSWGLLSGLIGLFIASISVFQSFGSNVDQRIENFRPLNEKLWSNQRDIDDLKKKEIEHDNQISRLWDAINSRRK